MFSIGICIHYLFIFYYRNQQYISIGIWPSAEISLGAIRYICSPHLSTPSQLSSNLRQAHRPQSTYQSTLIIRTKIFIIQLHFAVFRTPMRPHMYIYLFIYMKPLSVRCYGEVTVLVTKMSFVRLAKMSL